MKIARLIPHSQKQGINLAGINRLFYTGIIYTVVSTATAENNNDNEEPPPPVAARHIIQPLNPPILVFLFPIYYGEQ